MKQRLFHRFKAHETLTVVRYDSGKRRLTCRNDEGHEGDHVLQCGMSIDFENLAEGTRLHVQYGEITNDTSSVMGGLRWHQYGNRTIRRQIYTGGTCINAIAHANPLVQAPTVRMMQEVFGADDAIAHLRHYAEGASTLQTEIKLPRERYSRRTPTIGLEMRIEKGVLWAEKSIGGGIMLRGLHMTLNGIQLPDVVLAALGGRHASDLVEHPFLRDPELVIKTAHRWNDDSPVMVQFEPLLLTPEEAIVRIQRDQALPLAA